MLLSQELKWEIEFHTYKVDNGNELDIVFSRFHIYSDCAYQQNALNTINIMASYTLATALNIDAFVCCCEYS